MGVIRAPRVTASFVHPQLDANATMVQGQKIGRPLLLVVILQSGPILFTMIFNSWVMQESKPSGQSITEQIIRIATKLIEISVTVLGIPRGFRNSGRM